MAARRVDGDERSLAALRARVYSRDATPEDVQRYAARAAASRSFSASEPRLPSVAVVPHGLARPGGPHRLVAAGIAGLLATGVGGVAAGRLTAPGLPVATTAPIAAVAADDAIDDAVEAPAIEVQEQEPEGLQWQTERVVHGRRLPSDPFAQQFHGRGAGDARIDTRSLSRTAGRLEMLLTLAADGPALWAATRSDRVPAHVAIVRVLAERSGRQRQGVPVSVSFRYVGGPPTSVHVHVPHGVAWGLVVARRR